jgi:lyso-ornithine lipid O-acyltransferase
MVFFMLLAAVIDGQFRKIFFGMTVGPEGAVWVHGWCRRIVRALGFGVTCEGPLPTADSRGLAIVSNHLSYLDILLYASIRPFVMVAKTEVRSWPLLGWITAQAGTVYVQRADQKALLPPEQQQTHAQVNAMMATAFASGLPVLFFPEGTTTNGLDGAASIIPFRRGLYHSVLNGAVPMKAAAVSYSLDRSNPGACVADHVCYWGDEATFGPHLFTALGLEGLTVRMRFSADEIPGADRFALSHNSRQQVCNLYNAIYTEPTPAEQPASAYSGMEEATS